MKNPIYVISVFVICLSLGLAIFFYKLRQEETDLIRILEVEIEKLALERMELLKKAKAIDEQISNIKYDIKQYIEKIEVVKQDVSNEEAMTAEVMAKLSEREEIVSAVVETMNSLAIEENELKAELEEAETDYNNALVLIEDAKAEKLELEKALKEHTAAIEGVELRKIVVKLDTPLEGKVIEVNSAYDFAIVDLGQKDNLTSGNILKIYRDNRLIAKAVAENIYEEMSSIIILDKWQGVELFIGDTVMPLGTKTSVE